MPHWNHAKESPRQPADNLHVAMDDMALDELTSESAGRMSDYSGSSGYSEATGACLCTPPSSRSVSPTKRDQKCSRRSQVAWMPTNRNMQPIETFRCLQGDPGEAVTGMGEYRPRRGAIPDLTCPQDVLGRDAGRPLSGRPRRGAVPDVGRDLTHTWFEAYGIGHMKG